MAPIGPSTKLRLVLVVTTPSLLRYRRYGFGTYFIGTLQLLRLVGADGT